MVISCFLSSIFLTTLSLSRSMVMVDEEVSTSDASVDIEAESTSMITTPISISGRVESIEGITLS